MARPAAGAGGADAGLERLLQRCAAGDPDARRQLEALYGPRLRAMLARHVGQPELVEPVLQAALDEVCAGAADHNPERALAEDWLFGRVRAAAAARLPRGATRRVMPAAPAVVPRGRGDRVAEEPAPLPPRRARRWGRAGALLVLVAAVAALGAVLRQAVESQGDPGPGAPTPAPAAALPEPVPLPAPPAPSQPAPAAPAELPPAPSPPPVESAAGAPPPGPGPTWWDLPSTDPVPAEPRPPPASPAEPEEPRSAPPPGPSRIFIHYTAGSAEGAALARRLSQRLRQQGFAVAGIRTVRFRIGSGGVRYFFRQDREQARRVLAASMAALGRGAGPLPRGAGDFTHYAPKPQPGTVEVWLSTR